MNLEGRIQHCRAERQKAAPFAYEAQPLLALTALVAHQSRGAADERRVDGPARPFFEAGRALYYSGRASSISPARNATTTTGASG